MIDRQIRELASRRETKAPFLSLYLDTNKTDELQRDRLRLLLKDEMRRVREALGGNGSNDQVERGIRQIEHYIEQNLGPGTRGLAIFSCPAENYFVPIELPVPVDAQLRIGNRPHLRPLAELQQLHRPIAVAMVDAKSARLFELEFGRVLHEVDLEDPDMPRRHDQGGWSQANMQRHVQDHIDRHHKEVADVLVRMAEQDKVAGLIVSGQERNVANFRAHLPKRIDDLVLGTLHLDIRSSADEVIRQCRDVLNVHRAEHLAERLAALEATAQKNGRGALGFDAVVNSMNQRKLERLFLSRAADARGWKCTQCGTVGHAVPLGCPACGGAIVTVDLVEELIAAAQREGTAIEFVAGPTLLDRFEGVGALLRFGAPPAATGV